MYRQTDEKKKICFACLSVTTSFSSAQLGCFPARVIPGLRANGQDDAQFIGLDHEFLKVRRDRTINVIGMRGVQ